MRSEEVERGLALFRGRQEVGVRPVLDLPDPQKGTQRGCLVHIDGWGTEREGKSRASWSISTVGARKPGRYAFPTPERDRLSAIFCAPTAVSDHSGQELRKTAVPQPSIRTSEALVTGKSVEERFYWVDKDRKSKLITCPGTGALPWQSGWAHSPPAPGHLPAQGPLSRIRPLPS